MALNGVVLGDAIRAAVDAAVASVDPAVGFDAADRTAMWQAVGNAIVTHITVNAVVTTAGTATAVQAGAGTAPTTASGSIA